MQKKRFVAGAVCPRCAKLDKIMLYDDSDGKRWRECVSCGFKDAVEDESTAQELKTRVNQPRLGEAVLAHEVELEPIRLIGDTDKNKQAD
jgi:hypothetical protein